MIPMRAKVENCNIVSFPLPDGCGRKADRGVAILSAPISSRKVSSLPKAARAYIRFWNSLQSRIRGMGRMFEEQKLVELFR